MVFITKEIVEKCGCIIGMMENRIRHTKSMLVVKYNNDYDFITDCFMETLPDDVRMDANKNYPCVIVKYRHHNKILTSIMRVCNSFDHVFITNK